MNDDARGMLDRILVAAGTLEQVTDNLRQQSQQAVQVQRQAQAGQDALRMAGEQEEARFKQAMVALFREQQQKTEAALRPVTTRAWYTLAIVAGLSVLLLAAFAMLIGHEHQRLKEAQTRADAAEVGADVQEAAQHVEITSCGGRACIKVDKDAPTWKSKGDEYILVVPGKHSRK